MLSSLFMEQAIRIIYGQQQINRTAGIALNHRMTSVGHMKQRIGAKCRSVKEGVRENCQNRRIAFDTTRKWNEGLSVYAPCRNQGTVRTLSGSAV